MSAGPDMLVAIAVSVLLVVGSLFSLLAAVGLLRFPDLYTRSISPSCSERSPDLPSSF
jgi:multicomponent Na+:H+ antiporter subunit G